jgi:hypothetical protein
MSRYRLTSDDLPFAAEFLARPVDYHSPGLQRALNLMRGTGPEGKYVLLVKERYRRWGLGRLPACRGEPIQEVPGVEYTDLMEAERDIFKRRWQDLTGEDLERSLATLMAKDD